MNKFVKLSMKMHYCFYLCTMFGPHIRLGNWKNDILHEDSGAHEKISKLLLIQQLHNLRDTLKCYKYATIVQQIRVPICIPIIMTTFYLGQYCCFVYTYNYYRASIKNITITDVASSFFFYFPEWSDTKHEHERAMAGHTIKSYQTLLYLFTFVAIIGTCALGRSGRLRC